MSRLENSAVVLGCCTFDDEQSTIGLVDWEKELSNLLVALPCGLDVVGLFCSAALQPKLPSALAAARTHLNTNASLVGACVDDVMLGIKWSTFEAGHLAELETAIAPAKELLADMTTVRLTSKVHLCANSVAQATSRVLASNANFCVMNGDSVCEVITLPRDGANKCKDLSPPSAPVPDANMQAAKKGGKKSAPAEPPTAKSSAPAVVQLKQMWSTACEEQPSAPVVSFLPGGPTTASRTATLDVLGLFPGDAPLSEVIPSLCSGALRQLSALSSLLFAQPACAPSALHFSVAPHQPFPVTACFAVPAQTDAEESALLSARQRRHRQFMLPLDRPFLRLAQALSFAAAQHAGIQRLQNVHEGLPPSGLKGGSVHLVQGRYEYCHYMQDKFNDDGWGCMYRSYQTVLSWFRLQHYTNKPIQSHEEVQRMLVKMGDKPERFVGSKQWIGAMEASMLLDQHLGVQSKVINVASGHDLEDKGRELAHHFDEQGTPIPIGGGVLAFTILGVHFNPETGQVRFLILDPHYTGGEDLAVIQNQGKKNACSSIPSVGWHDINVFRKDSFYNLCLPQRPTAI